MTDNSLNISFPLKFDNRNAPYGMTDFDPKSLSALEQKELNEHKKNNIRADNVKYMMEHPEIKALIGMIKRMTMVQQPRNIIEFIAKIFTLPENKIRQKVNAILNETSIEYEPVPFVDYEDWDF